MSDQIYGSTEETRTAIHIERDFGPVKDRGSVPLGDLRPHAVVYCDDNGDNRQVMYVWAENAHQAAITCHTYREQQIWILGVTPT